MYDNGNAFSQNTWRIEQEETALFSNNLCFLWWNLTNHTYLHVTLAKTLWWRQDRVILSPFLRWSNWNSEKGRDLSPVVYLRRGRSGTVREQLPHWGSALVLQYLRGLSSLQPVLNPRWGSQRWEASSLCRSGKGAEVGGSFVLFHKPNLTIRAKLLLFQNLWPQ